MIKLLIIASLFFVFSNADDKNNDFYKKADGSSFTADDFFGDSGYIHTCDHPQYTKDSESSLVDEQKVEN